TVDGDVFRIGAYGDRPEYVPTFQPWDGKKPGKALQNTGLTADEIESLERAKVIEAGATDAIMASEREADVCVRGFWERHDKEFKAIETQDLRPETREKRIRALEQKLEKKLPGACKKELTAHRALAEQVLAPWLDARKALYDRASAALARLR